MSLSDTLVKWNINRLGPWFHDIEVKPGLSTFDINRDVRSKNMPIQEKYPHYMWKQIAPFVPSDLKGKNVLDLGCCMGYMSLKFAELGAQVYAVDRAQKFIKAARYISKLKGYSNQIRFSQHEFEQELKWVNNHKKYPFEIVFCSGVLYHLDKPDVFLRHINNFKAKRFIGESRILMDDNQDIADSYKIKKIGKVISKQYIERIHRESPKFKGIQFIPRLAQEDEDKMTPYYRERQDRIIWIVDYDN